MPWAPIEGVAAIEIAGNGYLNVRLDRGYYGAGLLRRSASRRQPHRPAKSSSSTPISIPIKPRTSATCATPFWATPSSACCAPTGRNVEVQNYIDNTGVQVADVVVGFLHLENKSVADVRDADRHHAASIICAGISTPRISTYYDEHKEALEWRRDDAARDRSRARRRRRDGAPGRRRHRRRASRDHVAAQHRYDVLPRESEILHLQFWATAFELLKERKAIYFETEGKNNGCWVMPGVRVPRRAPTKATTTAK